MKNPIAISSKYNTIILVGVGGLLAVILVFVFLMRPAWSTLKQLGNEIPKEQQASNLSAADATSLDQAKKFFQDNQQAVETVNTAVPIQPEVPSILVTLESLAKQNGVFLTSFSPQQVGVQGQSGQSGAPGSGTAQLVNPPGVDSIEVTANFRGPYNSLMNFLYSLERNLRLVDVKTLTVNSSGGTLEGNISFKAYYKQVDGGPKPTISSGTASSSSSSSSPGSSSSSGSK
ncbi:hypothetical protein EXS54_02680 [Patescibacteria group bacterium]|nr:hypothetical protein [Patescibacteria group bacterium]